MAARAAIAGEACVGPGAPARTRRRSPTAGAVPALSSAEPTTTHTDSGGHTSTPDPTGFVRGLGAAVAAGNDAAWAYATGYLGEGWLTEAPNPCTQPAPLPLPETWGPCDARADYATLYAFAGEPPCGWCPDLSDAAVGVAAPVRVLPDITPSGGGRSSLSARWRSRRCR